MFDVSFSELILIGVIALIVIGPERLPSVARTVGHLLGRAQRYVNDVKSDIQREMQDNDIGIGNLKNQLEDAANSVKNSVTEAGNSLREPITGVHDALKSATEAVSASAKEADTSHVEAGTASNMETADSPKTEAIATDSDPHTLPLPGFDTPTEPDNNTGKPTTGTHT